MSEYLSNSIVRLGESVQSLDESEEYGFSKVEIFQTDETVHETGNNTDATITAYNPWYTDGLEESIRQDLAGLPYQPYEATRAMIDLDAELGDTIEVGDVHSTIYTMDVNYGRTIMADMSAPNDEEVESEYSYEQSQDKVLTRKISTLAAQFAVDPEVISAKVSRVEGDSTTNCSWNLTANSFVIKNKEKTVLTVDGDGASLTNIEAKTGTIGGFTIGSALTTESQTWAGTGNDGLYIGTNGIRLGDGLKITKSGDIYCKSLKVWNSNDKVYDTITLSKMKTGVNGGYSWNTNGSTVTTNAGYGLSYHNATTSSKYAPDYLYVNTLSATSVACGGTVSAQTFKYGPFTLSRKYMKGADGNYYGFIVG